MTGEERDLIHKLTIRKKQRKWIGHRPSGVLLLRTAIQWKKWMERKQETIYCLCYFYNNFYFISFSHQLALFYFISLF